MSRVQGLAYMGEYPLTWAAFLCNEGVYNLLLDKGADPDAQDTYGNTVLHMVVVAAQLGMYGYALRHPRYQPSMKGSVQCSPLQEERQPLHQEPPRADVPDALLRAGTRHHLQGDAGAVLHRVLAILQHHLLRIPAGRARLHPAGRRHQ